MRFLFLGTGSGKISLEKGHTSILIRNGSGTLIDCGEGISRSLLNNNITYEEIDSIIISHFHADHIAGLPGLLTQMKITGRKKNLDVFVPAGLEEILLNLLHSFFIFREGFPFSFNIKEFAMGEENKLNGSLVFKGMKNNHIINKYNVNYFPPEKFISASFLFSFNDRNVFYTADIGESSDLLLFEERIDYIISEVTHITPEKLLQAFIKYEPEKVYMTHIMDDDKFEHWYSGLEKKIKKYFVAAHDGMELSI